MALSLTAHTMKDLHIEFGAPAESTQGVEVVATVNGQDFCLVLNGPDYLSCRPTRIVINGVRYDIGWWVKKGHGCNPWSKGTPGGWKERGLRLQRYGSNRTHDYTTLAFRLACSLMDLLAELIAADQPLNALSALVKAKHLAESKRVVYESAVAAAEKALAELVDAEKQADELNHQAVMVALRGMTERGAVIDPWAEIDRGAVAVLALPAVSAPK